jgi:regulator of sirC expression with transglutaminase-like and TPR domain
LRQVQERLVRLLPDAWSEHRDRGLACAELGLDDQALADLQTYLAHCTDAEDAPALRERMARISQPQNGRWAT